MKGKLKRIQVNDQPYYMYLHPVGNGFNNPTTTQPVALSTRFWEPRPVFVLLPGNSQNNQPVNFEQHTMHMLSWKAAFQIDRKGEAPKKKKSKEKW